MVLVLDGLWFVDLQGPISTELFNSWYDRDVHYPNGQHSLLISTPLSNPICHSFVSALICTG